MTLDPYSAPAQYRMPAGSDLEPATCKYCGECTDNGNGADGVLPCDSCAKACPICGEKWVAKTADGCRECKLT